MEERWIDGGQWGSGKREWKERREGRIWSGCKINNLKKELWVLSPNAYLPLLPRCQNLICQWDTDADDKNFIFLPQKSLAVVISYIMNGRDVSQSIDNFS